MPLAPPAIRRLIARRTIVLTLAAFAAAALGSAARAEVIISEIMYDAQGADSEAGLFNKEWVEIYNAGTAPVDIGGWSIVDVQDGQFSGAFPAGSTLGPGEALVITGDAATFDAQWGAMTTPSQRIEVSNFPPLANSPSPRNETLGLRCAAGTYSDLVNFSATRGWPKLGGSDGATLSLAPSGLSAMANDNGANWLPGMQGVYGGWFSATGSLGENHGSPGYVATEAQAPFASSPDAAWSLVVIPDTQNYVKSTADLPILMRMTTWIRDHRDEFGIQAVIQEGDIVNQNSQVTPTSGDQTATQQWQNARDAFAVLNGRVPYVMATGNHDYGTTSAQDRTTQFNDYFKTTDNPLTDPVQGGILQGTRFAGKLDNAHYQFTAPDGRDMVIMSLEWGPRGRTIAWANAVANLPQYADSTMVLVTHAYMYHDETRYDWARNQDADPNNNQGGNPYSYGTAGDTSDGEDLWENLVSRHEQFEIVLSGHVGGDGVGYLASTGDAGNEVDQMLFNTQFEANGGNGWLRVLEFLEDGETVRVRTFSPLWNVERTDSANLFEFAVAPLLAGDANGDGIVSGSDFLHWQRGDAIGTPPVTLDGWQALYGSARASQAAATPEPAAWVSAVLVVATLPIGRAWRRRCGSVAAGRRASRGF